MGSARAAHADRTKTRKTRVCRKAFEGGFIARISHRSKIVLVKEIARISSVDPDVGLTSKSCDSLDTENV